MLRLQAFKFEIEPNGAQINLMRQTGGCCRFVYNKALAYHNEQYALDKTFKFSYTKLANLLPQWKKDHPFLKDPPSQTLQQSLKNLESSFHNFFSKRSDYPVFKKKNKNDDKFRFPQGFKVEPNNNRIFFPKIGWIKYRNSRAILGEVKNITVSTKCGKWYASVQTEREVEYQVHRSNSSVGVDVGIAKFATLSDGTIFHAINSFKKKSDKLARYQRAFKNKVKFSENWKKLKYKIGKLHHQIACIRKDYLHKITTLISKNHAMIFVEDLKISNMSKSAAGTIENPGRNIKQKSGLNRSILDQAWAMFFEFLEYKQQWNGGWVIAVAPQYTSQTCPCCSFKHADNRKTQAVFKCIECDYENNADVVASMNIEAKGIKLFEFEGQDTVDASTGCESIAQIACVVNGAIKPSATGTRRSKSQKTANVAVGIPVV